MLPDRTLTRRDLPFPPDRPVTGQDLLGALPRLLQPMWTAAAEAMTWRIGHITTLHSGPPASVDVTSSRGEEFGKVRYLKPYAPKVGDLVFLLVTAGQELVLAPFA